MPQPFRLRRKSGRYVPGYVRGIREGSEAAASLLNCWPMMANHAKGLTYETRDLIAQNHGVNTAGAATDPHARASNRGLVTHMGDGNTFGYAVSVPPYLATGATQFTICARIRFTTFSGSGSVFNHYVNFGTHTGLTALGGGGVGMAVTTAGGKVKSGGVSTVGVWYDLVGVYDGANVYLYSNGALLDSGPQTGGKTTSGTLKIGGLTSASYNFDGFIYDVRLYGRAFTAAQAADYRYYPYDLYDMGGRLYSLPGASGALGFAMRRFRYRGSRLAG